MILVAIAARYCQYYLLLCASKVSFEISGTWVVYGILLDRYDAMATVDVFKSVISSLGTQLGPEQVGRIVGMMSMYNSGQGVGSVMSAAPWNILDLPPVQEHPQSWNIDVFVSVMRELVPSLSWSSLVSYLDYPEFRLMEQRGLNTLLTIYKKAKVCLPYCAV